MDFSLSMDKKMVSFYHLFSWIDKMMKKLRLIDFLSFQKIVKDEKIIYKKFKIIYKLFLKPKTQNFVYMHRFMDG